MGFAFVPQKVRILNADIEIVYEAEVKPGEWISVDCAGGVQINVFPDVGEVDRVGPVDGEIDVLTEFHEE